MTPSPLAAPALARDRAQARARAMAAVLPVALALGLALIFAHLTLKSARILSEDMARAAAESALR